MTDNLRAVIAIELLSAVQGCDFHPMKSSEVLERARAVLRAEVPMLEDDRYFAPDIDAAINLLKAGSVPLANLPGVA
jgi:histidine ammonia-lyase